MNKRGDIGEILPIIILVVILLVVFISYAILHGKLDSAIQYLQDLFRFGR